MNTTPKEKRPELVTFEVTDAEPTAAEVAAWRDAWRVIVALARARREPGVKKDAA